MSRISERIKKLKEETSGADLLKLKDGELVVVKFELDENGEVVGHEFDREYQGKKSKAFRFPVTMVNTGKKMNFPLALTWADDVVDLIERKKNPHVEVVRRGEGTNTRYTFQTV